LFNDVEDINTKNPEYILIFAIKDSISKMLKEKKDLVDEKDVAKFNHEDYQKLIMNLMHTSNRVVGKMHGLTDRLGFL
jgi:hypothetical protein